jgi:hypothetical protein
VLHILQDNLTLVPLTRLLDNEKILSTMDMQQEDVMKTSYPTTFDEKERERELDAEMDRFIALPYT